MKMNKLILTIIFIILCAVSIEAQNIKRFRDLSNEYTLEEKQGIANALFNSGKYYGAIDYYNQILAEDKEDTHAKYQLAESYRNLRYYEQAAASYAAIPTDSKEFPLAVFWKGMMLKAVGNYDAASDTYKKFILNNPENQTEKIEQAKAKIKSCVVAKQILANRSNITLTSKTMTSGKTAFGVTDFDDTQIIYTGIKELTVQKKEKLETFTGEYDTIYVNRLFKGIISNQGISNKQSINIKPDSKYWSLGSASFSPDKKKLYYTVCKTVGANNDCQIYYSKRKSDNSWSNPVKLSEPVNSVGYSSKHPNVIADTEGGEILFFSSNKIGGQGGFDLWYSKIDIEGNIKYAYNLGKSVNTSQDEITPSYNEKSGNLFFSSNGHPGLGQYDVFMVKMNLQNKVGKIYNLGSPVNSSADDTYFNISNNPTQGYLASNRSNNDVDSSATCCDRLYTLGFEAPFTYKKLPNHVTEIKGFGENDAYFKLFNEPFTYRFLEGSFDYADLMEIDDISINGSLIKDNKAVANKKVLLVDENGKILDSTISDSEGSFEFKKLPTDIKYHVMLAEQDNDMTVLIDFKDKGGNIVESINSEDNKDFFRYNTLAYQSSGNMLMNEDDISISGSLLDNNRPAANKKVFLVDEHGKVIDTAISDDEGNFTFKKLPADKNYSVLLDENDSDMSVMIDFKDSNGKVTKTLNSTDNKDFFKYNALAFESAESSYMDEHDVSIRGSLLADNKPAANKTVLLVDADGNVVDTAVSDDEGNFTFKTLPYSKDYKIVLDESDAGMSIALNYKNNKGETVKEVTAATDKNMFRYKNLDTYASHLALDSQNDNSKIKLSSKEINDLRKNIKWLMTYSDYEELHNTYQTALTDFINLRVQIGAYSKPKANLFKNITTLGQIDKEQVKSLTKYLVGNFDDLHKAEILRKKAIKAGISDAFIAVYHNGTRIAILLYQRGY